MAWYKQSTFLSEFSNVITILTSRGKHKLIWSSNHPGNRKVDVNLFLSDADIVHKPVEVMAKKNPTWKMRLIQSAKIEANIWYATNFWVSCFAFSHISKCAVNTECAKPQI